MQGYSLWNIPAAGCNQSSRGCLGDVRFWGGLSCSERPPMASGTPGAHLRMKQSSALLTCQSLWPGTEQPGLTLLALSCLETSLGSLWLLFTYLSQLTKSPPASPDLSRWALCPVPLLPNSMACSCYSLDQKCLFLFPPPNKIRGT